MRYLLAVILTLSACQAREPANVTVTVPVSSTLGSSGSETDPEKETARDALAAELEKLQDYAAVKVSKGVPAPESGILFSPRHAAEATLDAAEAEKLTVENTVLSKTRQQEIQLYEQRIKELQTDLAEARRKSFWDEHGAVITGVVGAVVAAGFSLGIFKASKEIREN